MNACVLLVLLAFQAPPRGAKAVDDLRLGVGLSAITFADSDFSDTLAPELRFSFGESDAEHRTFVEAGFSEVVGRNRDTDDRFALGILTLGGGAAILGGRQFEFGITGGVAFLGCGESDSGHLFHPGGYFSVGAGGQVGDRVLLTFRYTGIFHAQDEDRGLRIGSDHPGFIGAPCFGIEWRF